MFSTFFTGSRSSAGPALRVENKYSLATVAILSNYTLTPQLGGQLVLF